MILDYLISLFSVYLVVTVAASVHVVLNKRNSRAALGWIGMIVLFPYAGIILYLLFGINRVHRKAQRTSPQPRFEGSMPPLPVAGQNGASLSRIGYHISHRDLSPGTFVDTYYSGEDAYPPMLSAIDSARTEILLCSYIFDNDDTGLAFIEKLVAAHQRGVRVRILLDDVGIRYSFPSIIRELKKHGLDYQRFMPFRLIPPSFSINLRTHRKLLIIDRQTGFAGGMNIGDRQLVKGKSPHRASDLHFRFDGPVVNDFARLFQDDWAFCGGEELESVTSEHKGNGPSQCRLITDGPDENLDSLILLIIGAVSRARSRVWIMTPYFLPEQKLVGALEAAALSGVDVQVMIPEKNNWPLVQWALQHNMGALLDSGVSILRRPPPFAHSKCLLVDDEYVLVGSSNLDPRSLRLNFELGVEIFDSSLNQELAEHFETAAMECFPFTRQMIDQRGKPARLRDGTAALFGPYL